MMRTDHIARINYIGHCIIPHDTKVIPRVIKPDREEIEFLTGGVAYYEIDGVLREIGAGAILWHLGGEETVYKTDPANPYRVLVISFDVHENIGRQVPRCSFWKERENAELYALDLLNTYYASGYDKQAFCNYVYSRLLWNAHLEKVKQDDPLIPTALKNCMETIEKNFHLDITVESIALSVNLSVSYLHKLFKKHLNNSPHQVLMNRRLQCAKSLLSTTNLLIKEVAHQSGFVDVINFGRSFKHEMGMTPSQYRSKHTVAMTFGEATHEKSKPLICGD